MSSKLIFFKKKLTWDSNLLALISIINVILPSIQKDTIFSSFLLNYLEKLLSLGK